MRKCPHAPGIVVYENTTIKVILSRDLFLSNGLFMIFVKFIL